MQSCNKCSNLRDTRTIESILPCLKRKQETIPFLLRTTGNRSVIQWRRGGHKIAWQKETTVSEQGRIMAGTGPRSCQRRTGTSLRRRIELLEDDSKKKRPDRVSINRSSPQCLGESRNTQSPRTKTIRMPAQDRHRHGPSPEPLRSVQSYSPCNDHESSIQTVDFQTPDSGGLHCNRNPNS